MCKVNLTYFPKKLFIRRRRHVSIYLHLYISNCIYIYTYSLSGKCPDSARKANAVCEGESVVVRYIQESPSNKEALNRDGCPSSFTSLYFLAFTTVQYFPTLVPCFTSTQGDHFSKNRGLVCCVSIHSCICRVWIKSTIVRDINLGPLNSYL